MKKTLKIMSIISLVLCGFALLGVASDLNDSGAGYALIGSLYFGAQSIIALVFIKETK